jgi:hypothetical protein
MLMKILFAMLLAASLMACGSKAKKNTTPDNKTGTTETTPDGTGGTTYGGAQTTPAPTSGADPCAGQ